MRRLAAGAALGGLLSMTLASAPGFAQTSPTLGVDLVVLDDEVYITGVVPGTRAERAHLSPGQRLLGVNGVPVRNLVDVREALRGTPNAKLSLQVEDGEAGTIGRPRYRWAVRGFFDPWNGAEDVRSAWLGVDFDLRLVAGAWLILGFGYTPLGREAFVDGLNLVSPLLGASYEWTLGPRFAALGRVVLAANIPVQGSTRFEVEPLSAKVQAGIRFYFLEVYLSGGLGPAAGLNWGGGLGVVWDLAPALPSPERF